MEPKVSVVIATYNRSNVLALAIQSVIKSSFQEWELIVVSDASTDDTYQVVSSFSDPRIDFIELAENSGNQSKPNNEALKLARGKYIAFLSHDDLWFPDHLEKLINYLEKNDADLVLAQGFKILNPHIVEIIGAFPDNVYNPYYGYSPATLWLAKKDILDFIGGWNLYSDLWIAPSQDLLIRLYNKKYKILIHPSPSALIFPSGKRTGCYKNRDSHEQEFYIKLLETPTELRLSLFEKSLNDYIVHEKIMSYKIKFLFFRLAVGLLKNTFKLLNVNPVYLSAFLHHKRKGSFIKKLQKIRGLE